MNNVSLIGRICNELELEKYGKGKDKGSVLRFTLAVPRVTNKKEENTDFITCVSFNKTAELIEEYYEKGDMLAIEGKIRTGNYEDKETGKTIYTTDVIVSQLSFIPTESYYREKFANETNDVKKSRKKGGK